MKGGMAASIIAAEAFLDTVPQFAGAIEISGTADEESGGSDGDVRRATGAGQSAGICGITGYLDQKHIARIRCLHNCIAYRPGILDLAHKPDEYIGVDDMMDSAKIMALSLYTLPGSENAN